MTKRRKKKPMTKKKKPVTKKKKKIVKRDVAPAASVAEPPFPIHPLVSMPPEADIAPESDVSTNEGRE